MQVGEALDLAGNNLINCHIAGVEGRVDEWEIVGRVGRIQLSHL